MNVLIAILQHARTGINWDSVVDHLIQTNPELILESIEATHDDNWEAQVRRFALDNNKVPVIKLCRELSGMGLRDAKEWVETHCERFER